MAKKKKHKKPLWLTTLISLASIVLALSLFLLGLEVSNVGHVAWGVKIVGVNLGGQDLQQAQVTLNQHIAELQKTNINLILKNPSTAWSAEVNELGVVFDAQETAQKAFQIGRGNNIFSGLKQQVLAFLGIHNLPFTITINQDKLTRFSLSKFKDVEDPALDATLAYNPLTSNFDTTQTKEGQVIDKQELQVKLVNQISRLSFAPIYLSLVQDLPKVTVEQANQTKAKTLALLSQGPYSLIHKDKSWPIEKTLLLEWLNFKSADEGGLIIVFDQEEVELFLTNLSPEINQLPVNAKLGAKDKQTIIIEPSQDGVVLDAENTYQALLAITDGSQREIIVATSLTPAPIREETLAELGLSDQIGVGSSNYAGSSASRIHNIQTGIAKMNGYMIEPGEEFSFTTELEEVTANTGYLPEMVIKEKKLVPEYGGGLCQVSTTMFRSAIYSGLPITERSAHAFAVSYYAPHGFDSTIYQPHPDLRFINDTGSNILIQGYTSGTKAFFEFYGTSDGRRTELQGPYIYESNPDGSMKTVFTQQVFKEEELIWEKKFWSNYKSPALYPVVRNPLE